MKKVTVTRRSFGFGIGRLVGLSCLSGFPLVSASETGELSVFLDLSRYLTGFDDLDTDLAAAFYLELRQQFGEKLVRKMIASYQQILADPSSERSVLMTKRIILDDRLGDMGRTLIKLWYVGDLESSSVSRLQRTNAYLGALQWKAAKAKPMGMPGGPTWHLPL